MSSISIRTFFELGGTPFCAGLVTLILRNVHSSLEREIPRRSFLSRRAIDGTRGSKYFDPEEEGAFDSYGSAGGQYDPYEEKTDLSDIRRNVPGEPGFDYPAYTTLPQTGFTCEGRSRGYYADQVAGCQVFHVCHDVLVSSFLCPVGSTFSQKLLTCDWWTKVDCSSSDKYVDANRNSYQQDDDEMIRNAYAMISLRSGTDLTKDGLVDPDRIGTIVSYRQPAERIPDYASEFSAGNDLRSNDEYAASNSHRDASAYALQNANPEPSRGYQERPYARERTQSPYQDSPIIRVQPFDGGYAASRPRNKHHRNNYPRPNEFNNQFQPSYAPTVPTVTTTTRRFYSPTVPTTFRPSTLAYDKLDQTIGNSDYFFSRSGSDSFVTPPTNILHGRRGLKSPEASSARRADHRDSGPRVVYEYQYNYEGDSNARGSGNRSPERFQGVQSFQTNRTNLDQVQILFDRVRQRVEEEEEEDIEARDSVGLGQALRQSIESVSGKEKSSADDKAGSRKVGSTVSNEFQYFSDSYGTQVQADYQHTLARPEVTVSYDQSEEQTTEHYRRNDNRRNYSDTVVSLRIPLSLAQNNAKDLNTNESESSVNSSSVFDNLKGSESSDMKFDSPNEKETDKAIVESRAQKPSGILSPPDEIRSKFQIKVPDLSDASNPLIRHSTLDESYPELRVTESPPFVSTMPTDYADESTFHGEDSRGTKDTHKYSNDPLERFNSEKHSTSKAEYDISPTSPSFSSPSPLPSPVFTLPVINYTDNSNDFNTPVEWRFPLALANETEEAKTNHSAVEFQFPVGIVHGSTTRVNFDIDTTTVFPSSLYVSGDTTTNEDFEDTATIQPDKKARISVVDKGSDTAGFLTTDARESTMAKETVEHEDLVEAPTANALLRSIGPDGFQRIGERIEKNGSPYQVTVTVTKGEKLDLEVIKSLEPEINFSGSSQRNLARLDTANRSTTANNSTDIIDPSDSKKPTFNTVNLLQLMSELLKLNRVPRPFSRAKPEAQSSEEEEISTTASRVDSTLSANESSQASTKKQILRDRLTENLGKPSPRTDRRLSFDLPERERILDFRTGLPTDSSRNHQKPSSAETVLSATSVALSKSSAAATATTTTSPKTTFNAEAGETVVKTEFVPSIGFSLNTDEERKEYVEALLGGLIELQPTVTEEREVDVAVNEKEQYPKNETIKI